MPGQGSPHPIPTTLASGRYEVKRFLGEGSRKRVYLAHDTRLERDVAVALIKTDGLDAAGLARVRREARAMGRLGDHPNIVTVYDIGDEDGLYIVSQFMAGGSIDDLLRRADHRRLPMDEAVRLAEQLCAALEHAHGRGVIHRDVKPGNVWLTEDGTAKLGDFGLALAVERSRLTLEGTMVGTVAYMPPEQALGRPPEPRSDLYALGAMLYEMVTGRPPFLGDDAVAIISQHINTPPVAPSWHNPAVPRALEALIFRLLAKAPEARPESSSAVRQALAAVASAPVSSADRVVQEAMNSLDRLATGVFVGREREMDLLRAGVEDALSGRGRLVILVGEPGIGKTRTAEELATYAQLRQTQVLWGRCYEGEGAPPYWPWVQAVRAYVHASDPAALQSDMGSGAAQIAQMVSEVRERLPNLPVPPELTPEEARFRLFDSITTFFKNASTRQPLALVLDDLHWADKPSLLLLQFLARDLRGARVLVVGTYRDVDVRRQHPLAQTLAELAREQLSERVLLRGLTEHDVARFVEITAGRKPPAALAEAVYRETEGNPFFVNEVVRLLVADGRLERPPDTKSWSLGIPQSVREVIGRRLGHLSAGCNEMLTIASVIGREFPLGALEHVSEKTEDTLLAALEEAIGARIIMEVPRSAGRYAFTHALVRETLYEELSTTRRVRLHRRVAEALERTYGTHPEPHLAELAYHFCEAAQGGDIDRAIDYAVRAGHRAASLMAHEEAARQYEIALQILETREAPAEDEVCELLLTLSDALWCAGEYRRAKDTSLRAAEIAQRLGASEQLARAALGYGGRLFGFASVMRDETLVVLLEEVLSALGEEDSTLRAKLLIRLAEEIGISGPYERREFLCQEAIKIARRAGDLAVLSRALLGAHWALWVPENLEERFAFAHEITELAERINNPATLLEAHLLCFLDLIELGDVAGAESNLDLASRLADGLRQPYYQWAVAHFRATLAFAQGRLAEIESLAQQALALQTGREAENPNAALTFGVQMLWLYFEQGRLQELQSLLPGFTDTYPLILPNIRVLQAVVYSEQGCKSAALGEFESLAAQDFADLPRNTVWFFSVAHLSQVCAFLGDVQRAEMLYALLLPFAERNVTIGPILPFGSASRYLGLLAVTMGRTQHAARHFEDALEMNAAMGTRNALARTQVEYADLLLARDEAADRPRALDLLNQALETARELGMKRLVEQALALKLKAQGVPAGDLQTLIDTVAPAVAGRARTEAGIVPGAAGTRGGPQPPIGPACADTPRTHVLRQEGDYWTVVYEGTVCRLKDTKGLHYLAMLLRHPGKELHAIELVGGVPGVVPAEGARTPEGMTESRLEQLAMHAGGLGDAGEMLDPQAKQEYKRRIRELDAEIEEARTAGDFDRVARAEAEIESLAQQLASAVGLGGRNRHAGSAAERARVNVTRAIKIVMQKLTDGNPALGEHLTTTVKTGTFCSYNPDSRVPISWTF